MYKFFVFIIKLFLFMLSIPIFIALFVALILLDFRLSGVGSTYAYCIESRSTTLHGDLYVDGKTPCREDGIYTEEIDGIVYEFPSEQPFEGLIKYHDESDWKNPILLEWYEDGLLIKEMDGDEFQACVHDRNLKLLKYYTNKIIGGTRAKTAAWDVCEASEEWAW